jgi:hypothetical protein
MPFPCFLKPSFGCTTAHSTGLTSRDLVTQYRHAVTQLNGLNAPIPLVPNLSRMSELAALDDDYVTPIPPAEDNCIDSLVDYTESYHDLRIRQHDYTDQRNTGDTNQHTGPSGIQKRSRCRSNAPKKQQGDNPHLEKSYEET